MSALVLFSFALASAADAGVPVVGPLTLSDGLVPVQIIDGAQGPCRYSPYSHVELVDVETGTSQVVAPAWSQLLGELPDGAVVVTNETTLKAKELSVAVLERKSGQPRFSCSLAFDPAGKRFTWRQSARGLEAFAARTAAPSGVQRRPPPGQVDLWSLEVVLAADGCTLTPVAPLRLDTKEPPLPAALITAPGLKAAHSTGEPFVDLVLSRDGKPLWSRHTAYTRLNCAFP